MRIIEADARVGMRGLRAKSVDLSFWSPPYYVGKQYEQDLSFDSWCSLIREVLAEHTRVVKPGGFVVVNIADVLCFPDPHMPRFQADNVHGKKQAVTRAHVLDARRDHPGASRKALAGILGCSEQTVQRRLEGNNVRGGKHSTPTKVKLTSALVVQWAEGSGLYLYDQRIWHKDPSWANSQWHSNSYRAVDEHEKLLVLWNPGPTAYARRRLTPSEWADWGSRGVWHIPSVRRNGERHECEFPEELAERVIKIWSAPGDTILDPFIGSGTTAVAAERLGRTCIGIERSSTYASTARARLSRTRA